MIYAPIIESSIPAFTEDRILIPFGLNPAVSKDEIKAYGIQIKDLNTGSIVQKGYASLLTFPENRVLDIDMKALTDIKQLGSLTNGTFYKVQIAFLDSFDWKQESEGQPYKADETNIKFSDVAVGRCIVAPNIDINNWGNTDVHKDTMYYEGHTIQKTVSETVGEYRFEVFEVSTNTLIQDSGWQAHNSDNDTFDENNYRHTTDKFELLYELGNVWYKIRYSIKTNNGYEAIAENYIVGYEQVGDLENLELKAIHSGNIAAQENGYVLLQINHVKANEGFAGKYKIRRMKQSEGVWENIFSFELQDKIYDTTQATWLDITVEQGEVYQYKLVQYFEGSADNNFASTEPTEEIYVDFEDIFLSDDEKQLCIRYNPKISSLKDTIQEAKQDTLGGQYPYFFRNGNLRYKEIPLNGLLSYHMDENEMFMSKADLGFTEQNRPSLTLEKHNIAAERRFKLEVMNWLNNGKAKLFRSPVEGNYVVRIMNVSLSPTDTVGRMLHSFSGTGYEVADTSYASLMKNKLIFTNREVIDNVKPKLTK